MKRLYRNLRNWFIRACYDLAKWAAWPTEPPALGAIEKAKEQGAHYFVLKLEWSPEDVSGVPGGCWLGYLPDFDDYTQAETLPDAAKMAGDLLRINLEWRMADGTYPKAPDHTFTIKYNN